MKQTDYPELPPVADLGPENYIVALYKGLGWDGESLLDPTKVTINQQRWLDVCREFNELPIPGVTGYIWMNSGPSADADVPYRAVRIETGAFKEVDWEKTFAKDRESIDKTVNSMFNIRDGNVIELDADPSAGNDYLREMAYDHRHMTPDGFAQAMRFDIAEDWAEPIGTTYDWILQECGIQPHDGERYEAARDHLLDTYDLRPPYEELLGQEVQINILLGTDEESNRDFSSIQNMRYEFQELGEASEEFRDNALVYLTELQGYSYESLRDAYDCLQDQGFTACQDAFGPFLASTANELDNFPNVMGTVAILASVPIEDIPKLNASEHEITVPEGATVGIFAPWIGGGSMLDIELEKPLTIPTEMIHETQIEGVSCNEYTVNQVYGLVNEAWKSPVSITGPDHDRDRPLDDLMKEAKQKAAEKNITHRHKERGHKPPELGL